MQTSSRRAFLQSAAFTSVAFFGTGWLGQTLLAADKPAAVPFGMGKIEVTKLEGDLHVLLGPGGNIAVATGDDSAIVIDAGLAVRAKDILAEVGKLIGAAHRKTLLNTHWHFDHTGGNAAFGEAGWSIIAHENTRTRLTQTINLADLGMTSQPSPPAALPVITFAETAVLHAGSPIKVTKVAPAHTDTDVIAWFEKSGVLHTGDLFFNGSFPVIDRATGGSLDGLIAATSKLLAIVDDKTRIIPGHGPLATKPDLVATQDLLKTMYDRLAPFGQKGAAVEEVLAAKPLADLDDKWGRGFARSEMATKMAYGQWLKK